MIRSSVTGAAAYERGIGRWSRRLVPAFLDFSGDAAGRVLDIGCGTGILAESLLGRRDVTGVVGVDINDLLALRAAFLGGDEDGPRSFVARACAVGGRVPSPGGGHD